MLDEDEMMEKHNLLERLFELRSKKSELIKNMTNSEMKNGVDAILNVIMKSIKKKILLYNESNGKFNKNKTKV